MDIIIMFEKKIKTYIPFIVIKGKAYGYARLYLDEGALLEVRDMMTGNRLDSVLQEKGVYIQELSEYSYPLYYLDIEGEKIEAIYGKSNLKAS